MSFLIHDPLTRFIAQVAFIVLLSRALGLVVRRLGQPMVIAEITAGILLGPSLFGWVLPDVYQAVFAPESMRLLQLVSQLGLILFMFLVGLELDPSQLRGRGHTSVVISHTSIIVPFGLGVLLSLYLRPRMSDPGVSSTAFALFIGAAMSITAFPVLARILTERNLLRTRIGAITIACAAVDDVTAWCILAFVVAVARATGVAQAVITTLVAAGYIGAMLWLVRPLLSRVAARVANTEGLSHNVIAVTILLLLASSWATELIGIHALFGAFLFGAVLPKQGGLARALVEKLEDLVLVVLLPLFFAYSGVRTQIGLLDTPGAWLICGLIILCACVGKFGASTLAARVTGLPWREAGAVGVLMNTRGLMELIVLNIGLDLGVISPLLFTMMVLMALVTTFATTPVLQLIYSDEEMTRDLLRPVEPAAPARTFQVLVCVAHEGSGQALLDLAFALRSPADSLRAWVLHLVAPSDRGSFHMDNAPEQLGSAVLEPLVERGRSLDLAVKPLSFVSADPAEDICQVAEVKGVDLVLMGWHKPVLSQTLLGGPVYDVMKDAPSDVGVFINRGLGPIRRVLVPFLGSPHDRAALALAQRAMAGSKADVTILHVVSPEPEREAGAGELVDGVFDEAGGARATLRVVEHEQPIEAVLDEAAAGYDLVLVGMGREWGLEERFIGVQRERLMLECPTSLLVVRKGERAAEAARVEGREMTPAEARS